MARAVKENLLVCSRSINRGAVFGEFKSHIVLKYLIVALFRKFSREMSSAHVSLAREN